MRVWVWLSGVLLVLGLGAGCDGAGGRDAAFGGGPKGDDPNAGGDDTALLDGEMLALLEQANDHLGDENDWPDDGQDGGNDGANDGGNDGAGGGSCDGQCGSTEAQDGCFCDAACAGNNDCCGDYQAKCGGDGNADGGNDDGGDGNADGGNDDGGDGDGNADGGEPAGSCSGQCGSSESQNGCFCDDLCASNGDCCGDYQAQCPGSGGGDDDGGDDGGGDGGADGGADGGGDGGAAGTCVGHCGGAGSDGVCFCDDMCEESGDCCDDFSTTCPAAVAEPAASGPGAFIPEVDPARGSSACLKVIDGDVNVGKILNAAGKGAAKQGARCFAVAVVVSTASGGTGAPATSVVCLAATVGGGAVGAAKSYIKQKRSDIALCTAETLSTIMTAILGAQNIGVFEMAPPVAKIEGLGEQSLTCQQGPFKETNYHSDDACGPNIGDAGKPWGSTPECRPTMQCEELKALADKLQLCSWARIVGANTGVAKGNPNAGHRKAIKAAQNAADFCQNLIEGKCDEEFDIDSKADSQSKAMDLICN